MTANPYAWRDHAACLGASPDLFFPERGDTEGTEAALAVCATCPVRPDCLAAHIDEREGVWGGTSARQRRQMRGQRYRVDGDPRRRPCGTMTAYRRHLADGGCVGLAIVVAAAEIVGRRGR